MSTVIEVVIGMSLVYLVVSAGASAMNEFAEGLLKRRSKYLQAALNRAINTQVAADIYETRWVKTLMTPLGRLKKGKGQPSGTGGATKLPSYIPSDIFAAAIREILDSASDWSIEALDRLDDAEIAEALAIVPERLRPLLPKQPTSVSEIKSSLESLASNEAFWSDAQKTIIGAFPPHVFDNLDNEARNLQRWYEATMDRMSGWYKRRTRWWLILWGALIAVAFNIDSLAITRTLWTDEVVRDAAVATATEYAKANETCSVDTDSGDDPFKCVDEALDELNSVETLGIPLGWNEWPWNFDGTITTVVVQPVTNEDGSPALKADGSSESEEVPVVTNVSDDPRMPADGGEWILKILGLLGTAIAVSFGAPVWFDILNKFVNFRASGVKPAPGGTSGELDKPTKPTAGPS